MNVENINFQSVLKPLSIAAENTNDKLQKNIQPFDVYFNAYLDMISETNKYQVGAEQIQLDYSTNKTDDILAVMLAQEKAYSTLSFTVQVTNKLIESYKEIMRIQL